MVIKGISLHDLDRIDRSNAWNDVQSLRSLAAHPNLMSYSDSFLDQAGCMLFLVMPCVDEDLRSVIHASQLNRCHLAGRSVASWMQQAASALRHLHNAGKVHANLNPTTIFLQARRTRVLVGNCGIAPIQQRKAFDRLPDDSAAAYMSPEAMQNERHGPHSDMWALGCVLFELCTRAVAFKAASLLDFALQVIQGEPDWSLWNVAFAELQDVTKRLLQKASERRPTATEFLMEPAIAASVDHFEDDLLDAMEEDPVPEDTRSLAQIEADRQTALKKAKEEAAKAAHTVQNRMQGKRSWAQQRIGTPIEECIRQAEDDLKVLETTISDLEKSLADGKEEIATLTDEIAALTKGLEELDKQVEEATVNRKEENEDYQTLMANNGAALEIIGMAKNRLNKFYNPALVPAAFIQLHMQKDAPPPPPATWDAYSKKSEESNGVIAMMDSLVADLEKEMQEAELEEKDAQGDYEQFTRDAAEKRVQDSKSITEKEGAKAEAEVNLVKETKERQTKMKEALATVNYIEGLHKDCDWLLKNYDVRKSARTGEVDALTKAKAVLSGADFSLVQTNSKFLRVRK